MQTPVVSDFIMTKKKFRDMVEETVRKFNLSHLDAILHLCEEHNIEPEDVKKYMSPVIKDKLEADAIKLRFLSNDSTSLPLD